MLGFLEKTKDLTLKAPAQTTPINSVQSVQSGNSSSTFSSTSSVTSTSTSSTFCVTSTGMDRPIYAEQTMVPVSELSEPQTVAEALIEKAALEEVEVSTLTESAMSIK